MLCGPSDPGSHRPLHPQLQLWAYRVLWPLFPPWSESGQSGFPTLHLRGLLRGLMAAPVSCRRGPSITGASWDGLCVQQGCGDLPPLRAWVSGCWAGARVASWPPLAAGSWPQPGPRLHEMHSCPGQWPHGVQALLVDALVGEGVHVRVLWHSVAGLGPRRGRRPPRGGRTDRGGDVGSSTRATREDSPSGGPGGHEGTRPGGPPSRSSSWCSGRLR